MLTRNVLAAAALSMLAVSTAGAQYVVDVNQPLINPPIFGASRPYIDAMTGGTGDNPLNQQSFKAQASSVAGGGFFWHAGSGWYLVYENNVFSQVFTTFAEVEISLFPTMGLLNGGPAPLAQTRVTVDVSGGDLWIDAFWNPVTVTPGATYFLGIRPIAAAELSGPVHASDVYAGGAAYSRYGVMDAMGLPPGQEGFYDFGFRTWTTAPEPSTWALMAAGLIVLGFIERRRRYMRPKPNHLAH